MRRTLALAAVGVCLAAAGVALAAGGAGAPPPLAPAQVTISGGAIPADPSRLATSNGNYAPDLVILGYKISCIAIFGQTPGSYTVWYGRSPLLKGAQEFAYNLSSGFDPEQLASCQPNAIITSCLGAGYGALASIAPLACVAQPPP